MREQKQTNKETISEGDFVEIEYTGKTKDGNIFDTNKQNSKIKSDSPKIFCIGQKMLLESLENKLIGKKVGEKYKIEINSEQGFGKRKPELIKTLPIKIFTEKNQTPRQGMFFALDNVLVKILSVSGGRVIADFNNPLAGKDLIYEVKIIKKIKDMKEKIKALIHYFFKKQIKFELKDKKIILKEKNPYIKIIAPKFKEILGLDLISEQEKNQKTKNKN